MYPHCCYCSVAKLCLTFSGLHRLEIARLLYPWILQARILEWVVMPSSRGSSWIRDPTGVSGIGNQILYHWVTREVLSASSVQFSPVQSLSRVWLFVMPWIAAHQASLSNTNSRSSPNSCASSQWCHPATSSSVIPFSSCPQSLPASGTFPASQLFAWGGQSIGVSASASVLPMYTQDWTPLGWTGWISL